MTPAAEQWAQAKVIEAAGGILRRSSLSGDEVLIVHRKRYGGDWTLPKGKLRPDESFLQAAVREVREETGYLGNPDHYLGAIGYEANGTPKVVLFWLMSPVSEDGIADRGEVGEAIWLPIRRAVEQLSYRDERLLLARLADTVPGHYRSPGDPHAPWPRRKYFPWLQGKRAYSRLFREIAALRIDLEVIAEHDQSHDKTWASAARDHIACAERFLANKDIEASWFALHAARRSCVYGLTSDELARQAVVLNDEAGKITSWRGASMRKLLSPSGDQGGAGGHVNPGAVADAMELRDEFSANEYHKIWLSADQLGVVLFICAVAFVAYMLGRWLTSPIQLPEQPWGVRLVATILMVGLLGAAFSTVQSLMGASATTRIPERVANHFVTIMRTVFGAIAGLAGYAFWESNVLNITVGKGSGIAVAITVAFIFGYSGDRLVQRVAASIGTDGSAKKVDGAPRPAS